MDKVSRERESAEAIDHDAGVEHATFLNLIEAAHLLTRGVAEVLRPAGLTPTQFNVLRVLRCAGKPLHCSEMGDRLSARDPDVTRLLDRLEQRGLIGRARDAADRRVVVTTLTDEGRAVLAEYEPDVDRLHRMQLAHLGPEKLETLAQLLAEVTGKFDDT